MLDRQSHRKIWNHAYARTRKEVVGKQTHVTMHIYQSRPLLATYHSDSVPNEEFHGSLGGSAESPHHVVDRHVVGGSSRFVFAPPRTFGFGSAPQLNMQAGIAKRFVPRVIGRGRQSLVSDCARSSCGVDSLLRLVSSEPLAHVQAMKLYVKDHQPPTIFCCYIRVSS
jgi:hypothetical protein